MEQGSTLEFKSALVADGKFLCRLNLLVTNPGKLHAMKIAAYHYLKPLIARVLDSPGAPSTRI